MDCNIEKPEALQPSLLHVLLDLRRCGVGVARNRILHLHRLDFPGIELSGSVSRVTVIDGMLALLDLSGSVTVPAFNPKELNGVPDFTVRVSGGIEVGVEQGQGS